MLDVRPTRPAVVMAALVIVGALLMLAFVIAVDIYDARRGRRLVRDDERRRHARLMRELRQQSDD